MSCTSGFPTFRLLDAYAGWDQGDQPHDQPENLVGFADPEGLRLRLSQLNPNEVNPSDLLPYLAPPQLARGCGSCDWYLITAVPPSPRLLRRDPCSGRWVSIWEEACAPDCLLEPVAVAAWRKRVAVSDRGARTVWVWSGRGSRLSARIELAKPGPLAFTPQGGLLVAAKEDDIWRVHRFGHAGEVRGSLPPLPPGRVDRLAVSHDCAVWLILEKGGALEIWRLARGGQQFESSTIKDDSLLFRVGDLKDLASLAVKLQDDRDPLSQYLQRQISPETQRLLEKYDGSSPPSESLLRALVNELNRLLKGPSLYNELRFAQVMLTEETQRLVDQNLQGEDLVRLNRLLLEEAYPHEIAKRLKDLRTAFKPTGLTAMSARGFCLEQRNANNIPIVSCFSWYGRPLCDEDIPVPSPIKLYERGQLLTKAIDSGIPRCRWHRVRIDADVPSGTTLEVAVSTSEAERPAPQGESMQEGVWQAFHAGVPHPRDWHVAPLGSLDSLIQQQPPGRYLFVRLRFTGNGTATPVVRRVRLEFPRKTSLDLLPPVYRDNPDAEDFSERFLSLFDASIADLDAAIERYPALLDPDGVPSEVLPWLGTFVDVTLDRAWDTERRRSILRSVPALYRKRGTVDGLKEAIDLVFGIKPAIQEIAAERMWGAIAMAERPNELKVRARLGEVRLFGRASSRFRLGSSALSRTPLRSFGNPDRDPLSIGAYRFHVLVPPTEDQSALWRERLRRLIESQKPAHTIATVRVGGNGFVLGTWSAIGVDTMFGHLAPPVLAKTGGNVRLNRMSVLWPGPHGVRSGMVPNQTAVVGVKTVME